MRRCVLFRHAVALVVPAALLLSAGCGLWEERPVPPEAPVDVRASQGEYPEQIVVVWREVERADEYRLLRARGNDDYEPVGDPVGEPLYRDTDATTGSFWYKVLACGPGGCSAESEATTGSAGSEGPTPPLPPTGVRATGGEYRDSIRINWNPAAEAEGYIIHRAEQAAGPYEEIALVEFTNYRDEAIDTDVVYWYRVQSRDQAGRKSMLSAFARGWAH